MHRYYSPLDLVMFIIYVAALVVIALDLFIWRA